MSSDDIYNEMAIRLYRESPHLVNILKKLMTPQEARMLLALPATPTELSAKFGLDEETIKKKLQEFQERGLAIPSKGQVKFAGDVARPVSAAQRQEVGDGCQSATYRPKFLDLGRELPSRQP